MLQIITAVLGFAFFWKGSEISKKVKVLENEIARLKSENQSLKTALCDANERATFFFNNSEYSDGIPF
ncbi:MAG: hypothetical protein P1P64_03380 [Treponemataceae bacterium]